MNMILHDFPTANVVSGNTLFDPKFKDGEQLRTFDYVVANPPFSDKTWSTGLALGEGGSGDRFQRFTWGVPPKKQGDYAYPLHIIRSMKSTGKAACILPHGVLFRGNAEAVIRRQLVRSGYLKAIIGLPANLFFGTGIPACIVVLDKENAITRKGVFMIDASRGFKKDGPKNRLREQDIHKIVDAFARLDESDPRYARLVPVEEIADPKNDYNLNLPRYIDSTEPEDLQDIDGHLRGGIPERDLDALVAYWKIMPGLLGGLDRLIAKKRDLKQAALQQLLTGQTRLPGFHGEWEVKRLGEVAEIRSGGTPSTGEPRFWDGDIPWCTPTDITALNGHKYLGETARMITQLGLKSSSAEMIPPRSVVMTSRATIGECAINAVPVSTNQGFKNFVPFATTDIDFLYYLLGMQKQGFISLCGGSTFLEIGKTQLVAYKVRLPNTKAEQTGIAEVLTDMDAELAALEQRREKTRALKQAMMQELLTGRVRLI